MPAAGPRRFRSSRAFLVRSADVGEADRRLSFFTEDEGEVTLVAKSAHRSRKRFGGALQRYVLLDITWTEVPRRIPLLTGAAVAESFWNLLEDWERVRHADYLLELSVALFPQPGPKPKAFSHLLSGIRSLSRGAVPHSAGRKAEAALLAVAGFGPDLSSCKRCGKADRNLFRFQVAEGRIYCDPCSGRGGLPLSLGAVKTWRVLQSPTPAAPERLRITEKILNELQAVIPKYLEWCIGKPLRSLGGAVPPEKP